MACHWARLPLELQQKICLSLLPQINLVESPQGFSGMKVSLKVINSDEVVQFLKLRLVDSNFCDTIEHIWNHESVATLALDMEARAKSDTPITSWFAESKLVPTLPMPLFGTIRHLRLTQTFVVRLAVRDNDRVLLCRCNSWSCRGIRVLDQSMIVVTEPYPYFTAGMMGVTYRSCKEAEQDILDSIAEGCGITEALKTDPSLLQEVRADDPICRQKQTRAQHLIYSAFTYRIVGIIQATATFTRNLSGMGLDCIFGLNWDGDVNLKFNSICEDELLGREMETIRSHVSNEFQRGPGLGESQIPSSAHASHTIFFFRLHRALCAYDLQLPRRDDSHRGELIMQPGISWRRFLPEQSLD